MIDQTTLEGKVITAAFDLAASPGWDDVSLRDIADAAGCSLADVMETFGNKDDILKVFSELVDRKMLHDAGDVEREQSSRDAVFEVIMSRFDNMTPFKAGLNSILGDAPISLLPPPPAIMRMHFKTQNKILQAAGINATGTAALVRQLGLARLYDQVLRTWLKDDDPGMARTMAALDRRLRQGERSLQTIDEVTRSSERMCEQATSFAARLVSIVTPRFGAGTDTPQDDATMTPGAAGPCSPAPGAAPTSMPSGDNPTA